MARRWTIEEDEFLFHFYCETTERMISLNDLERTASAIRARVKRMKETGAWKVLEDWNEAMERFQEKYDDCFSSKEKPQKSKHLKSVK